tara:strand:+ start:220 stop:888 length:669 start_codon:yes stop_codon:yes gene_type:complete
MSGLKVITGPSIEPITLSEARNHLRLDLDVDDTLVNTYIQASRNWAENYTGRAFINRTMQMFLDGFRIGDSPLWEGMKTGPYVVNYSNIIELGLTPVSSLSSINYYTDDDTQHVWAASNYYVDLISEPAKIVIRDGGTYPTSLRPANGLEINFVAGYGDNTTDVPQAIRLAMLQFMAYLYEHRGDYDGNIEAPSILRGLLEPFKVYRFNNNPYNTIVRSGIA